MSVFQWAERRLLIRKGTALPRMNQWSSFLFYRQSLSLLTFRIDDICLSQLEEEKNSRSVQLLMRSEWMVVAYLDVRGDWSFENGRKGQVYQWWKSFNVARLKEWRAKTLWRRHHMSLFFIWTENPPTPCSLKDEELNSKIRFALAFKFAHYRVGQMNHRSGHEISPSFPIAIFPFHPWTWTLIEKSVMESQC